MPWSVSTSTMVRTKRPQCAPAAWRSGASSGTATVVARKAVMRSCFTVAAPLHGRWSLESRSFEEIRLLRMLVLDIAEHLAKMGAHHRLRLRRIAGEHRLRDGRVLADGGGGLAGLERAE